MKKFSIIVFCILLCFSVNCFANGQGSSHHNDTITNDYYNTYDSDYDYIYDYSKDYDITNNYMGTYYHTNDNRVITNNDTDVDINNTYMIDNSGVENNQLIQQHNDINLEANTLLNTRLTDSTYYGMPIVSPDTDSNVIYCNSAKLYFNPSQIVLKLNPDEFATLRITITADRPLKMVITSNRPNIKILKNTVVVNKSAGTAYTDVMVSLDKGNYWNSGLIIFSSVTGEKIDQIEVTLENKQGIDHLSKVTMDETFTSIGHGVRQNRGTWGWAGFVGIRINRETNEKMAYGTLTYDW